MSARVIPLPTALKLRDQRVEAICAAVAHDGPRPLIDAEPYDGQVLITVGELEIHVSPTEALAVARRIMKAAGEALGTGGERG